FTHLVAAVHFEMKLRSAGLFAYFGDHLALLYGIANLHHDRIYLAVSDDAIVVVIKIAVPDRYYTRVVFEFAGDFEHDAGVDREHIRSGSCRQIASAVFTVAVARRAEAA